MLVVGAMATFSRADAATVQPQAGPTPPAARSGASTIAVQTPPLSIVVAGGAVAKASTLAITTPTLSVVVTGSSAKTPLAITTPKLAIDVAATAVSRGAAAPIAITTSTLTIGVVDTAPSRTSTPQTVSIITPKLIVVVAK
jgi:hypothetical protein